MLSLYAQCMVDDFGSLNSNFKNLEEKCFIQLVHFPIFDEPEWVGYVLRKIHDEFLWLDKPYKITKKAIQEVTYLSATGIVPKLWHVKNTIVMEVTSLNHNNRSMTISEIVEHDVRFAQMVIGYKVYQSSRYNSIFDTTIYATYQMLKEDKRYDLCEVLLNELMSNIKKIKQDKKHVFKFGSLIICLELFLK